MDVKKITYDPSKSKEELKKDLDELKNYTNIIYFFYDSTNNNCLYIGETGTTLFERCFRHTPKESDSQWFKQADTIFILKLDDTIDNFSRRTIESLFITTHRPQYNAES